MPIKSYLAHPQDGKKEALVLALSSFTECDVFPAENREILIVVTETKNKEAEKKLKEKLESINSLKLLAMVSGFKSPVKK
ncbi:MAG: nitrate reductase NapAB chaperone NapD [Parvicellaceae bacterium]|jgi:nitrate reductase NapAB chaperone NapD